MGILKHWPAFVIAMAVLVVVGPARGQQIQPEEFTIRHGLSQGYIACMLQDREGFLWAGTKNGLNRFDGRRFQVFVNDPANPFSISHDYVNTLFEHGDFLLVGTNGGSLNIFHKKTRRFFRMPDSLPGGRLSALSVIKVAVDAQGDICLIDWKSVLEGNLYHIRLPQGFWERLERGEAGWAGAFIRKVSDDDIANFNLSRDGRRLYYTKAGALEEVDLKTGALRTHPHPGIQHACRILVPGPNNLVWISGKNGLLQFDGQTWTLLKAGLRASWMAVSPSGDYLLFNDPLSNGVYRCALSEYNGSPRLGDVSLLAKVSDFSTALADRSGNVWIGTGGIGLMKTSVQTSRFRTYFAGESISSPPFSTEDGGYAYTWEKENPVRITLPDTRHPVYLLLKKFAGLGLRARYLRDHQGNHWLYYQKSGQNNLVRIPPPGGGAPRSYAFKTGEVHLGHFAADTDGQIYIGLNGVLYRFNPKTEQFTEHVYQAVQPRGSEVRSLAKTPDGRWWLGTFRGLVEAKPNTTGDYDFRLWQYEPGDTNSLRNNDISSLLPDPNDPNFLWIGTKGGGLARMDINSGAFKHLTTRDGLPNDVIYAVLADEQGYLWLSSNKGLIRYQPESGQIKNFTEADGLQSDEFNTWAYGKTPGGELMFGGVKGLNVFHPKDIVDNPNLPPVFLTGLKISNRAVTSGDSTGLLTQTLEFTEKIRLPFSQNNITLEFAALEYTVPSKNRFRYYLEGAETEWAHEGSEPSAQYLSLAPGNYTFKVIACNNDGVWNPVPATLHITVLPPWYRSWWAWLFYAAAIGALIYLYMRFRIGQIHLQQSLALEQQEAERVRELDEFKSRLFTNITHEFRTPLTVVLGTSEQLEKQVSELAFPDLKTAYAFAHELKNRLALIRRNGRNLLDLVNQLLDLAKAESNQLKIHLVQGDVVGYIRYIAESFLSLSNQRNVLLTVDSKLPEMVMDYDPEKLRQILSNLISNALKYTPSGGRVQLTVGSGQLSVGSRQLAVGSRQSAVGSRQSAVGSRQSAVGSRQQANPVLPIADRQLPTANCLLLTVSDSGAGIAPEDLPHIFDRFYQADNEIAKAGGTGIGLALTKELVKLLGGEITAESELGKGSTFTVKLPITNKAEEAAQVQGLPYAGHLEHLPESRPLVNQSPNDHPATGYRLLIIEDNPDVVEYLRLCLEGDRGDREGRPYGLQFAYNGRAGIEQALETVPDLILSDVMMPEKDGFEVCDFLKNDERTSHIPVVLLTAKADMESRITGLRRGADAYLAKPFHPQELMATLENLLVLRRKLQIKYAASALSLAQKTAAPDNVDFSSRPTSPADIEDVFLQKLRAAVEPRLGDADLSVEDVCRAVGMGRSNLYAKLSALTNLSFNIYVRTLRLHKAKALLETTDLNVSEAAYKVGFDNPKYFSRVFSDLFGFAPSELKKS